VNNAGFSHGPFFFVFLLGFLQAQYTYTGFDASAHMSEETRSASLTAARGVVNSIVVSAVAGYLLIMAITFAIKDLGAVTDSGSFAVITVLQQALGKGGAEALLFIAVIGQLFCGMSAVTAASRMLYAFSRDRAVPGWRMWSRLNAAHVPSYGVILIAFLAFLLALPAWSSQTAFVYVAITSIATIGLYIAYILPVFLRLRAGDSFDPGPWTLGRWYRVVDVVAIAWVIFICILFILPVTQTAIPFDSHFDWKTFNYAPIAVGVVILLVGAWWMLSARHWFKGPIRTVETADDAPPPLEALPEVM
jgi:amino acid transporter